MPPMSMNCVDTDMAKRFKDRFGDSRHFIHARVANITQPLPGRAGCMYRNKCSLGCPYGGHFSRQSSTLPGAVDTGYLTLRPWPIVACVLYDIDVKNSTGVEVLDAETNDTVEYNTKIVLLCASAFISGTILMRSA